jgi:GTPase SAR1 family protein
MRQPDGADARLSVWYMSGDDQWIDVTLFHLRDVACAILLFNLTDQNSFAYLPVWHGMLDDPRTKIVLVGTQLDKETERNVHSNEAQAYAHQIGAVSYVEVSSKTGENIDEMMQDVIVAAILWSGDREDPIRPTAASREAGKCSI